MLNSGEKFLKKFVEKHDFIEGLVLSDKEGIEIFSGYRTEEHTLKENQAATMFVVALTQSNDNFLKLSNTKMNSLTLIYDIYIVYITVWQNTILSIFAKIDANLPLLYQISDELQNSFSQINQEIEKLNK